MLALVWAMASASLMSTMPAHAAPFVYDRIAAVVGTKIILLSDLEYELRSSPLYFEAIAALGANPAPELVDAKREELRSVVLDQLIGDYLVMAEAERIPNASVTEEEVNQQLSMLAQNNKLSSVDELRKIVEKAGDFGTWDRYVRSLRRQIGVAKMEQAAPHSAPTEAQVRARYREMAKGEEAKVEVLRWFFPGGSEAEKTAQSAVQRATAAKTANQAPEDFAQAAGFEAQPRELSQGQSAPSLDRLLFAAKAGDIVGPVPATGGYLVFWVKSLTQSKIIPFEEASPQITRQLDYEIRTRELKAYRERLRLRGHVEIRE
jgi:hypothetical protein